MKKLIVLICVILLFLYPEVSFAYTGDGTSGNPYTGLVSSSVEWIGTAIYAEDLVIVSGATLTISPDDDQATFLNMVGSTLTIESGGTFIINPNASASIYVIENDGVMRLESAPNEPGVASLIHDIYFGTGTTQVRLYLSGGTTTSGDYRWHYISMPFSGVTATSFSTLNLAQYIESLATSIDNFPGWVAYDGYQYSSGTFLSNVFSILEPGKGYNYYASSASIFTMTGTLTINDEIEYCPMSGVSEFQGYNLIGNPFASTINWQTLVSSGQVRSVDNAIYFTNNGSIQTYVGGVGIGASEFIPPMQGFFVKANAANGRVIFRNAARVHNPDLLRYKKKSTGENLSESDTISLVRLRITVPEDSSELVVRFNKKATSSFDKELDAYTFSRTMGDINMWTTTGGIDYCINGLPFPETSIEVPVGVNLKIPGAFRLSTNEIKNLEIYNITLKDLITNQVADLKKGEYLNFTAEAGMVEDRFILTVTKSATDINNLHYSGKKFSVYTTSGRTVNIRLLSDEPYSTTGLVTVYDISGRNVIKNQSIEWAGKGDIKQIAMPTVRTGVYLVVIETRDGKVVEKVTVQ